MQFESEKVVNKIKEDGETRAKQEVYLFLSVTLNQFLKDD